MNKTLSRILRTIPMLAMMIIIYSFSAGTGEESGSLSLAIAQWVSKMLEKVNIDVSAQVLHLPIRKLAHMSEYAVLAITVMWAVYGVKRRYLVALVVSVLYAISDECHQLFVSGRAGTPVDVLIDSAGVIVGLVVYRIVSGIANYKRQNRSNL